VCVRCTCIIYIEFVCVDQYLKYCHVVPASHSLPNQSKCLEQVEGGGNRYVPLGVIYFELLSYSEMVDSLLKITRYREDERRIKLYTIRMNLSKNSREGLRVTDRLTRVN